MFYGSPGIAVEANMMNYLIKCCIQKYPNAISERSVLN